MQTLLALLHPVASSKFGSKSKFALERGNVVKSKHFNETTGRRDAIAQRENSINQNELKLFSKYARFESTHVPIYLNDTHARHN